MTDFVSPISLLKNTDPMRKIFILLSAALCVGSMSAQDDFAQTLQAIEQNNTALKALRAAAEAEKAENRADLSLDDPEIEFNQLWGSPQGVSDRRDFKAIQPLDWGTLLGKKRRVAACRNNLVDENLREARREVLLEARRCLLDLTNANAQLAQLEHRRKHLETALVAEQRKLDEGEGTQLEYNKVSRNMLLLQAQIQTVSAERDLLLTRLAGLNGGEPLSFTCAEFPAPLELPESFSDWWQSIRGTLPAISAAAGEVELSRSQLALTRAGNWPSLAVGYMREKTFGEHLQGITVGITIPLWNTKRRLRSAKAAITAAEIRREDVQLRQQTEAEQLFRRVHGLRQVAETYRRAFTESSNAELLEKALAGGQISVLEFVDELNEYFDAADQLRQAEYEYHSAVLDLPLGYE